MRSASNVLQSIVAKLPVGFALGRRGGVLDTLLRAAGQEVSDAEVSAAALMNEIDPRQAIDLLGDFERVLGPDPCGRDGGSLTLDQRQRLAHQRWTTKGGQSIAYMASVADKLAMTIEIEEFWPSRAGVLRAGQRLRPEGSQFTWLVVVAEDTPADMLASLRCLFRRIQPGHTEVGVWRTDWQWLASGGHWNDGARWFDDKPWEDAA